VDVETGSGSGQARTKTAKMKGAKVFAAYIFSASFLIS